jgi:hypothetical protein
VNTLVERENVSSARDNNDGPTSTGLLVCSLQQVSLPEKHNPPSKISPGNIILPLGPMEDSLKGVLKIN